jgi:hydroxypyruvate isomerase
MEQRQSEPSIYRIHQSVVRWPFQDIPLDAFCKAAAEIGLEGIDVLMPDEYEVPRRYGLHCTMAFAGLGDNREIGMNRLEYHDGFEASLRKNAPLAEKAGITSVIAFSGSLFPDLNSEQGLLNTIAGLKRLAPIAADHGLTICMEPQNSKRDHPGYMCDTTAWGLKAVEAVGSPNAKLLYDIYHMQIMEGDVIETIRSYAQWFHHYHTGGVPGRHELGDNQEIFWPAVMRAIVNSGFTGYVAHEFVPTQDPLAALAEAFAVCSV